MKFEKALGTRLAQQARLKRSEDRHTNMPSRSTKGKRKAGGQTAATAVKKAKGGELAQNLFRD